MELMSAGVFMRMVTVGGFDDDGSIDLSNLSDRLEPGFGWSARGVYHIAAHVAVLAADGAR